LQIRPIVHN